MQQLIHAVDDVFGLMPEDGIGQGFDDDLRPDTGRVAKGDRDGGTVVHFAALSLNRDWRRGKLKIGWKCGMAGFISQFLVDKGGGAVRSRESLAVVMG